MGDINVFSIGDTVVFKDYGTNRMTDVFKKGVVTKIHTPRITEINRNPYYGQTRYGIRYGISSGVRHSYDKTYLMSTKKVLTEKSYTADND